MALNQLQQTCVDIQHTYVNASNNTVSLMPSVSHTHKTQHTHAPTPPSMNCSVS